MALVKELGPYKYQDGWWDSDGFRDGDICPDGLDEFFEIDREQRLWLLIYDRPAKQRLRFRRLGPSAFAVLIFVNEQRHGAIHRLAIDISFLELGKNYYVEVQQATP